MFSGTGFRLGRAAVAAACAASLATPAAVRASEGSEPATAETSEELNSQAQKHASKAVDHFNRGAYVDAEEEFRRVAFFAPNWRPLHFNLAVLAEAQGKLGTAVSEYQAFRPHGSPDEQLLVDQRLDELGRRRERIARTYRRQIGVGASLLTLGLGSLAGGVTSFVFHRKRKDEYAEAMAWNMKNPALPMEATQPKGGLIIAGYWLTLVGVLLAGASAGMLVQAVKSKRKLDSIALGKARLQWAGGAAVQLQF
ncbi:hypothetical protein [Nannocystis pusilla]|uniref:Tetratricopeptide repeat protein n=1 Tax=Nannocystis pusilla TaxID=889268 RepID=A0ABS7TV76_9BACT|nr:hypothetical protein [Nannocystis pusilla]MBZ5712152.1 hypothetical protein [Nannocystis pusilla]